jgi:hypothetical protein
MPNSSNLVQTWCKPGHCQIRLFTDQGAGLRSAAASRVLAALRQVRGSGSWVLSWRHPGTAVGTPTGYTTRDNQRRLRRWSASTNCAASNRSASTCPDSSKPSIRAVLSSRFAKIGRIASFRAGFFLSSRSFRRRSGPETANLQSKWAKSSIQLYLAARPHACRRPATLTIPTPTSRHGRSPHILSPAAR